MRLWVAAGTASIVLVLFLATTYALGQPHAVGIRSRPQSDGTLLITWVVPASQYWDAGLRPGDIVRRPDQVPEADAWAAFEVVSGAHAGQTLLVGRSWPDASDGPILFLGLEFLAAGLLVYLRAYDRPAARRFLALASLCAGTLVATPPTALGHAPFLVVEWVGDKATAAAFASFFLTTPVQRWRPFRLGLLAAFPVLVVLYAYAFFVRPAAYDAVKLAGFAYLALGLGGGLLGAVWPFLRRSPAARRQMRPVLVATSVSIGVFVLGSLLPYTLFGSYLIAPTLSILAWALIPLGFVLAILRYSLMGVALTNYPVLRAVFEHISDPVFVVRRDHSLLEASRSGLELLGVARAKDAGPPFDELTLGWRDWQPRDIRGTRDLLCRVFAGEVVRDAELDIDRPDGTSAHMNVTGTPILNERGEVDLAVLVCHDITAREQHERLLAYLSAHDPLTGLANRRAFEVSLNRLVDRAREGVPSCLLFIDLDQFKAINDTYGHAVGDQALVMVASLMREQLRGEDVLARLGGDEFAVLLEGKTADEGVAVAERLHRAVAESCLPIDGHAHHLNLSIGVTPLDERYEPADLLRRADLALYEAKRGGRDCIRLASTGRSITQETATSA